ncbi:MAG: hypothetical protein CVU50_10140 [Candidatus Cloacimonetes bacterium HGW-Cloacimonetes-3]|jgi:hypothetical protein|nr:MAG: hypothetical protein CVU50_10140 [Candidatus Cloacimonetes bacterium HGW-Cloacimonetes-3]
MNKAGVVYGKPTDLMVDFNVGNMKEGIKPLFNGAKNPAIKKCLLSHNNPSQFLSFSFLSFSSLTLLLFVKSFPACIALSLPTHCPQRGE